MVRTLYLLRHGKSDWSQPVSDYKRPLTERGVRESGRLGAWMKAHGRVPERVLCSAAERARHTAVLVTQAFGLPPEHIEFDEGLYLAAPVVLLDYLQELPDDCQSVMLTGHNPGLEELLVMLAGKAFPSAGLLKVLPTGTLATLSVSDGWVALSAASCSLVDIVRGKNV